MCCVSKDHGGVDQCKVKAQRQLLQRGNRRKRARSESWSNAVKWVIICKRWISASIPALPHGTGVWSSQKGLRNISYHASVSFCWVWCYQKSQFDKTFKKIEHKPQVSWNVAIYKLYLTPKMFLFQKCPVCHSHKHWNYFSLHQTHPVDLNSQMLTPSLE